MLGESGWLGPGSGRVGWCYICVCCESGLSVHMAGPGICILWQADCCASLVHPVCNPVTPYRYLLPTLYLSVADIANPDLLVCGSRTWISLDITRFYKEHCQPSSGSAWPACPKNGNRSGGGSTQFAQGLPDRCDSSTACRLCRLVPILTLSVDLKYT